MSVRKITSSAMKKRN